MTSIRRVKSEETGKDTSGMTVVVTYEIAGLSVGETGVERLRVAARGKFRDLDEGTRAAHRQLREIVKALHEQLEQEAQRERPAHLRARDNTRDRE